jgi:hypothetical protein
MPRSVLLAVISLCGLLLPTKVLASEYDWKEIGSLNLGTLRCPHKKKPSVTREEFEVVRHACKDRSGRLSGPFIDVDESGKLRGKGIITSGSLLTIIKRVEYFKNGLLSSRGVKVNGLEAGRWEYWWINGKRRSSIEFEPVELIADLVTQNKSRPARVISVGVWDENGNEFPPSVFEISCSDLVNVDSCPWSKNWVKNVEEYFDPNPGGFIAVHESPLGLEWNFIRYRIIQSFRDIGLAIAYSGQSEQVLLVLTAPTYNPEKTKSSHYRIRITRTTECPDHICEMSLSVFRMDAPIESGKIMWPKLIGVDDEVTQSVARMLDVSMTSFQGKVKAVKGKLRD